MDRRYSGMRFYNGVRASNRGEQAAEKLLDSYMSNARSVSRKAQNYGGSTGGNKSLSGNRGLEVIKQRNSKIGDLRKIFEQEGTGRFGARKEAWIAKQYDPDVRQQMQDRQRGVEEED